ncbi:hypothetical protein [Persephonella sp.]
MKEIEIHILRHKKLYNEIEKHIKRLEYAFDQLKKRDYLPLTSQKVEELLQIEEVVPILDQITYRYSKIQETLGKLIRSYLYLKGENVENLPIIDVINTASKYGIDIDKEKWFELRELRNILVHEYEDEADKIANTLNKIFSELTFLKKVVNQLKV